MRVDLSILGAGHSLARRRRVKSWVRMVVRAVAVAASVSLGLLLLNDRVLDRRNHWDRLSSNPLAANQYRLGVVCARRDTEEGHLQGREYFKRAVELDPKFAMAYNGLYEGYVRVGDFTGAHQCAAKMLELDPELAEGHAALGLLAYADWHWPEAEPHFQRAIQLNPNCAIAHMRYGYTLLHAGRIEESRRELLIAEQMDATFPRTSKNLGHVYYVERRFREAIAEYQRALQLEPSYPMPHRFIGQSWRALGDYLKGIDEMEIDALTRTQDPSKVRKQHAELRLALATGGTNGYWRALRHQGEQTQDFYLQAQASARLDDWVRAFEFLNAFYRTNKWLSLDNLVRDESWDPMHQDPRYVALLRRTGLRQ